MISVVSTSQRPVRYSFLSSSSRSILTPFQIVLRNSHPAHALCRIVLDSNPSFPPSPSPSSLSVPGSIDHLLASPLPAGQVGPYALPSTGCNLLTLYMQISHVYKTANRLACTTSVNRQPGRNPVSFFLFSSFGWGTG